MERNGFLEQQGRDCAMGPHFLQRACPKYAILSALSLSYFTFFIGCTISLFYEIAFAVFSFKTFMAINV